MRKSNRIWRIEIKLIFRINYSKNVFRINYSKNVFRINYSKNIFRINYSEKSDQGNNCYLDG